MLVNAVQVQAQRHHLKATTVVGHDPVAEGTIATARQHECDLVVMISHGRKRFKRLLVGSETLDVLTHAAIPVLVLR